ncbi:MAG: DUF2256 and DUF3253 domain-containing protein [Pseudomonadota bacterium]
MSKRLPEKDCVVCGRTMTWRKKWARNWDAVRYCSDACRKRGLSDSDRELEDAILETLRSRPRSSSACPSEVAKRFFGDGWRTEMETVRTAARRLENRGQIVITQKGKPVDSSTAKGPVRLRLAD